ncbi:copper chaperone PCu(A)C [Marinobacterium weihaiense]|uniref:Copper chaperone PCu(A)C n=1 Tax=Marinobacterium weihaiense TaxID=2851016 RepID=A0ABS6MBB5_9GAMM|nr:copper chaperone PCu(A)C [Marinobacterium weihaiense]MBV0933569.1 copper chaperone PCu(A)C [Marinobacterium weihaiense]
MNKSFASLLTGCLLSSSVFAADVQVDAAHARATAPGQPNSAVFMQLTNTGNDTAITGASSSAAKVAELHTHMHDQGVMRMRRIDAIELPAAKAVTLQPGGLHIMLIGLDAPLQAGSHIDLTLEFADGTSEQFEVPVKQVMPAGMQHGKGMQH